MCQSPILREISKNNYTRPAFPAKQSMADGSRAVSAPANHARELRHLRRRLSAVTCYSGRPPRALASAHGRSPPASISQGKFSDVVGSPSKYPKGILSLRFVCVFASLTCTEKSHVNKTRERGRDAAVSPTRSPSLRLRRFAAF